MKKIFLTMLAVAAFSGAYAQAQNPLVCIAGSVKPDGSLGSMTGNPAQVAILQDGKIALYTLNDPFSLFHTNYTMSKPFDMSLVKSFGVAGTYKLTGSVANAEWIISDDGTKKIDATVTVDTDKKTGKIENNSFNGGNWAGTTQDKLNCSDAGTIN